MSPQNIGRLPIISDTTRTYRLVENAMGDDDPQMLGWYVAEDCPVNGKSLLAGPYADRARASEWLNSYLGE